MTLLRTSLVNKKKTYIFVVIANLMRNIHKNKFEIHQKKENNNVNQLYFTKKKIVIIICLKVPRGRLKREEIYIYILISL